MAKQSNIVKVTSELYSILEPLDSEDRMRAINAVLVLLNEEPRDVSKNGGTVAGNDGRKKSEGNAFNEKGYFDSKQPNNKIEELATAARYREEHQDAEKHTKDDLKAVIKSAKRNFDDHNFNRDISNATTARLFNTGGSSKDGYTLSHFGENYVDALPDREAIKKLKRPKRAKKKKSTRSKAASNKK